MRTILFDLDGTLLPMDVDHFTDVYFDLLAQKVQPYGFEAEKLKRVWWKGTAAMYINDGTKSNEDAFWQVYEQEYGKSKEESADLFLDFYSNEFNQAVSACQPSEKAREAVEACKERGFELILATNPIFPEVATINRLHWAGCHEDDFIEITTYENSRYSKPNLAYYQDILQKHGLDPQDCLMVGNDVNEDLAARALGIKTFLVSDCLLNTKNLPVETDYQGSLAEFAEFIKTY